jgi:hypothetical protein
MHVAYVAAGNAERSAELEDTVRDFAANENRVLQAETQKATVSNKHGPNKASHLLTEDAVGQDLQDAREHGLAGGGVAPRFSYLKREQKKAGLRPAEIRAAD